MVKPRKDARIQLRDGRSLAYCEWGDAAGPAVLGFHGSPGSRVWWPASDVTDSAGARLITVDRPGYGGSDSLPGRPIAGWAEDMTELATALGIERFGVVGWSGGAPYAAAVAAALPDRLTGICLSNSASVVYAVGLSEPDAEDTPVSADIEQFGPEQATLRYAERLTGWAHDLDADPASLLDPAWLADGDRWMLDHVDDFAGSVKESVRQGAIGAATDWVNLLAPWGFSLGQIQPVVHLWHGEQDVLVQRADFERAAAAIPRGRLTVWDDAGHFGLARHWAEVLEAALG